MKGRNLEGPGLGNATGRCTLASLVKGFRMANTSLAKEQHEERISASRNNHSAEVECIGFPGTPSPRTKPLREVQAKGLTTCAPVCGNFDIPKSCASFCFPQVDFASANADTHADRHTARARRPCVPETLCTHRPCTRCPCTGRFSRANRLTTHSHTNGHTPVSNYI